jgi:LAGLIDADG DNA endonuclease family
MLNKEKRSTLLSFLLGDGHLASKRNKINKHGSRIYYGEFSINHSDKQKDYLEWKRDIFSKVMGKPINIRKIHQDNKVWDFKSIQHSFTIASKKFRAWRKFCYPNNKKDSSRILKFILDKNFALAVWLMDDGNCQATSAKFYEKFTAIRLHTCSENYEGHVKIAEWFKINYGVEAKIRIQHKKKLNKQYYYLVFNVHDSLVLWPHVRDLILSIPSMKYKFRTLEHRYQLGVSQPQMRSK